MAELTQERLKEVLLYNPNTGVFTRRIRSGYNVHVGDIAGWVKSNGYVGISIDNKFYLAHRLAFLYMEGKFPLNDVDHINQCRDDNRYSNLRLATRQQNMRNRKYSKSANKSGALGVSWHKKAGKWRAYINVNSKQIHLGLFDSFDDAVNARLAANKRYGFSINHGAKP